MNRCRYKLSEEAISRVYTFIPNFVQRNNIMEVRPRAGYVISGGSRHVLLRSEQVLFNNANHKKHFASDSGIKQKQ